METLNALDQLQDSDDEVDYDRLIAESEAFGIS